MILDPVTLFAECFILRQAVAELVKERDRLLLANVAVMAEAVAHHDQLLAEVEQLRADKSQLAAQLANSEDRHRDLCEEADAAAHDRDGYRLESERLRLSAADSAFMRVPVRR